MAGVGKARPMAIYQAVLKTYTEMHGVSLDDALEEAIRQSSGKENTGEQVEQYKKAYKELKDDSR